MKKTILVTIQPLGYLFCTVNWFSGGEGVVGIFEFVTKGKSRYIIIL